VLQSLGRVPVALFQRRCTWRTVLPPSATDRGRRFRAIRTTKLER